MSLPTRVQGATRPSLLITWLRDNSTDPEDLTGATLTGFIRVRSTTRAITGTFEVTDADGGVFRWDLSEADVESYGKLKVQFVATFASGQTPAKTFKTDWEVESALAVS